MIDSTEQPRHVNPGNQNGTGEPAHNLVILDIFGGEHSQIPGAINVDIKASSGILADAVHLPVVSNQVDEVIMTNPFIDTPERTTFQPQIFSEALRVLKPGGRLIVNATRRNPWTLPRNMAEELGFEVISSDQSLDARFSSLIFRTTDGYVIPNIRIQTSIFRKSS